MFFEIMFTLCKCLWMGIDGVDLVHGHARKSQKHVLYADPRRLYSFTLEPGALQALDQAGEAFIAAQLERGFRTLDYYKALLG